MGTSREEKKKIIGDLLKAADRYIQSAEYTDAMGEVNKALAVEPDNMYALAYNQRIKAALAARKKKDDEDRVKKLSEEKSQAPNTAAHAKPGVAETVPAETAPAASHGSSEEDLFTIRQQRAQIVAAHAFPLRGARDKSGNFSSIGCRS